MPDNLCFSSNIEEYRVFTGNRITIPHMTFSYWSDTPYTEFVIGEQIRLDKFFTEDIYTNYSLTPIQHIAEFQRWLGHDFTPVKITVSDEILSIRNGKPFRQWLITVDGYIQRTFADGMGSDDVDSCIYQYSVEVEQVSDEALLFKVSLECRCFEDDLTLPYDFGDNIELPGVPVPLSCKQYSFKHDYDDIGFPYWGIFYDAQAIYYPNGEPEPPLQLDISTSYELNGTTVRSVDGQFVALRRSLDPIVRKSISFLSDDPEPAVTLGDTYEGGIALSENIVAEEVSVNDVSLGKKYRHNIEVEA